MANGHSLRMATALLVLPAGPSSLCPIHAGGVWKAGVRLSGPDADPRALLAVVRGGLRWARQGLCRSLRVSRCSPVPLWSSLPRGGGGWAGPLRCMPFPSGVCTRGAFASFVVLLERSGLWLSRCPLLRLWWRFPFLGVADRVPSWLCLCCLPFSVGSVCEKARKKGGPSGGRCGRF